jgi:hypothetical protein
MKPSEIIRTYGWKQNDYGNKTEGFCILGALHCAGGSDPFWSAACPVILHQCDLIQDYVGKLPDVWNDEPGRMKDEVIAALEAVGL